MTFRVKMLIPAITLSELGYKKRKWGDFIKNDSNGRFHAKIESVTKGGSLVAIHYDFFGSKNRHITNIPMPNHIGGEQTRIANYMANKS